MKELEAKSEKLLKEIKAYLEAPTQDSKSYARAYNAVTERRLVNLELERAQFMRLEEIANDIGWSYDEMLQAVHREME